MLSFPLMLISLISVNVNVHIVSGGVAGTYSNAGTISAPSVDMIIIKVDPAAGRPVTYGMYKPPISGASCGMGYVYFPDDRGYDMYFCPSQNRIYWDYNGNMNNYWTLDQAYAGQAAGIGGRYADKESGVQTATIKEETTYQSDKVIEITLLPQYNQPKAYGTYNYFSGNYDFGKAYFIGNVEYGYWYHESGGIVYWGHDNNQGNYWTKATSGTAVGVHDGPIPLPKLGAQPYINGLNNNYFIYVVFGLVAVNVMFVMTWCYRNVNLCKKSKNSNKYKTVSYRDSESDVEHAQLQPK